MILLPLTFNLIYEPSIQSNKELQNFITYCINLLILCRTGPPWSLNVCLCLCVAIILRQANILVQSSASSACLSGYCVLQRFPCQRLCSSWAECFRPKGSQLLVILGTEGPGSIAILRILIIVQHPNSIIVQPSSRCEASSINSPVVSGVSSIIPHPTPGTSYLPSLVPLSSFGQSDDLRFYCWGDNQKQENCL